MFEYDLKTESLAFGEVRLEIECLRDIEATIDSIFGILSRENRPELLEELCPYFGALWPAAVALTQYIERDLRDRRCAAASALELGCGLALPSLLLAKKGWRAVCTDRHPDVPRFLERNLKLNHVMKGVEYRELDWQTPHGDCESLREHTWIVGSDVLYESRHPEGLAELVAGLIGPRTERILLSDPGRPYLQTFIDALKRATGRSAEVRVEKCEQVAPGKEIFVLDYRLREDFRSA